MRDYAEPGPSACARLKQATAQRHHELEAQPLLVRLMGQTVSQDLYGRVLMTFAAYHVRWETAVFDALAPVVGHGFLAPRRKLPSLAQDLGGLTLSMPETEPAGALSLGEAVGRFYVQEGATMGGVVIHKHLGGALPAHLHDHRTFFHGHGRDTARMWEQSCKEIERLCSDTAVLDDAVLGACSAFNEMMKCVQRSEAAADLDGC